MNIGTRGTPIALIGTRGFGGHHLRQMARLRESGRVDLVGVVDVVEPEADVDAPWFTSLDDLLAAVDPAPEVVIVSTPINTHRALAEQALRSGAHVYLEKPPVPSLTDHAELLQVVEDSGLSLQVGFQARGGGGVARMWELLTSGVLGEVRSVDAYGAWLRDRAYYQRSSWAGKRVLDGKRVADGVGTNPLAHAIDVALVIAGITQSEQVAGVTRELRHAHPIEADDTASIRIDPVDDDLPFVQAALTTTAPKQSDPWVRLRGTAGTATLFYTADRIELEVAGERTVETFDRESLVENLLDHLTDPGTPLISPLGSTGAFMTVLEATQTDPDPSPIGPEHVTWVGEGLELHPVVQDVEAWMSRALDEGRTFTEVGAPWGDPDAVVRWRAGRAG